MQNKKYFLSKRVVLVGGSTSHIVFLKKWMQQPIFGVEIILIDSKMRVPYTGMISGYLSGNYKFDDITVDLFRLTSFSGAKLVIDKVQKIKTDSKKIILAKNPSLSFDILCLAAGFKPKKYATDREAQLLDIYPTYKFIKDWSKIIYKLINKNNQKTQVISVIGYSLTAFEIALCINVGLKKQAIKNVEIQIIASRRKFLGNQSSKFKATALSLLMQNNIKLLEVSNIQLINKQHISFDEHPDIVSNFNILCESTPNNLLFPANSSYKNFDSPAIFTDQHLQVQNIPYIFATGSNAKIRITNQSSKNAQEAILKEPSSGVKSVAQGKLLYKNIKATLSAKRLKAYQPKLKPLSIINTGDGKAIWLKGKFVMHNSVSLFLKNAIDWSYIKSVNLFKKKMVVLPPFKINKSISNKPEKSWLEPVCYGCAAKVELSSLKKMMTTINNLTYKKSNIRQEPEFKVVWGLQENEDVSAVKIKDHACQVVQSIDFLQAFNNNPFKFSKIATLHALNDIFAKGVKASFAHSLVILPYHTKLFHSEELEHITLGIIDVLNKHNIELIGGHSSLGEHLGLAISFTSLTNNNFLWQKNKLRAGDQLILTKPLGTGILLKAAMLNLISGKEFENLENWQMHSNKALFDIEYSTKIKAATDISGFGLVNHLNEMLVASKKYCSLFLSKIPLLNGALRLAKAGIQSSLTAPNHDAFLTENITQNDILPFWDNILFDPQTSGGILLAVAKNKAVDYILALKDKGFIYSEIIGEIKELPKSHTTNNNIDYLY